MGFRANYRYFFILYIHSSYCRIYIYVMIYTYCTTLNIQDEIFNVARITANILKLHTISNYTDSRLILELEHQPWKSLSSIRTSLSLTSKGAQRSGYVSRLGKTTSNNGERNSQARWIRMIKNDWIVGARFNYEQDTLFPRYTALLSTSTDRRCRAQRRGCRGANF